MSTRASPSTVRVPRSPPDPFTASTLRLSPVIGSSRSTLTEVLPPPKFVTRRSDPRRSDRSTRATISGCSRGLLAMRDRDHRGSGRPLSARRSLAAKAASGKVEDLLEALESGVRALGSGKLEELSHLGLPAGVHVARCHCLERRLEVVALQVPDQEAVFAEKQRVVAPPRLPE